MSTQNLFGQYYTTKANKSANKYQNYEYICSTADDGTNNAVVIDDSKVQLIDANGNELASLDLENIKAQPVLEHNVGSFVLRPYEVRTIEGLERGKTFKKMYFIVPEEIPADYLDDWRYFMNVDFDIVYESGLDTKEFNIETVFNEETLEDILVRMEFLINQLGLSEFIKVDIETIFDYIGGGDVNYITFTSLQEGYDFLVSNFKIHTFDYGYKMDAQGNRIRVDLSPYQNEVGIGDEFFYGQIGEDVVQAEDNVVFSDGTVFGEGEPTTKLGEYESEGNNNTKIYSKKTEETVQSEEMVYGFDYTEVDDDNEVVFIIKGKYYDVVRNRMMEQESQKYPNGAAQVWFVVPEYPTGSDSQKLSILLNHIQDRVFDFAPIATKSILPDDASIDSSTATVYSEYLYEKRLLDVCASLKDEKERRLLSYFKEYMMCYEYGYMDASNGAINPVSYEPNCGECCPCRYSKHNPHIGLWGYVDHVCMYNEWTKVGQMYGLVTEQEDSETYSKNLASSVLLFNPNEFPVKINFFVAS